MGEVEGRVEEEAEIGGLRREDTTATKTRGLLRKCGAYRALSKASSTYDFLRAARSALWGRLLKERHYSPPRLRLTLSQVYVRTSRAAAAAQF